MFLETAEPFNPYPCSSVSFDCTPDSAESSPSKPTVGPILPLISMYVRGELDKLHWGVHEVRRAYQNFRLHDFIGPDDLRLAHLHKSAESYGKSVIRTIRSALKEESLESAKVYGRAKSPLSIFLKLVKNEHKFLEDGIRRLYQLGDIFDFYAIRIDLDVTRPNFEDYYRIKSKVEELFPHFKIEPRNYLVADSDSGYRGRLHLILRDLKKNGFGLEIQIGSKDMSSICDMKVTNASGQTISLHDASYKSKLLGINFLKELREREIALMRELTAWNGLGKKLSESFDLQGKLEAFRKMVENALPSHFPKTPPFKLSDFNKLLRWMGKIPGPLSFIEGITEVNEGTSEFFQLPSFSSLTKVGVGTMNFLSGAAIMTGQVIAGSSYGGGAAILQGFQQSFNGTWDQYIFGTLKVTAGSLMTAGAFAVNPVALTTGGFIYGATVLYENRKVIRNGLNQASNWLSDHTSKFWKTASGIMA